MHAVAYPDEIARAVRETLTIAINQLFVAKLVSPGYRPLLELLIQSYAKKTGQMGGDHMPASPVILRQLVEVIMKECGMLEYTT
jgi:hypothetical protein